MPRLFVAIDLPDAHAQPLAALQDDRLQARWTPLSQFHLTLRFLGDASEDDALALEDALSRIEMPAFRLHGEGVDVFPSRRKPRVLFVNVASSPALLALQRRVEGAATRAGFAPSHKPFIPHVTLARLKQVRPRDVRAFLRENAEAGIPLFPVETFHLYESILRHEGAEHVRRATFSLSAG